MHGMEIEVVVQIKLVRLLRQIDAARDFKVAVHSGLTNSSSATEAGESKRRVREIRGRQPLFAGARG